MMITVNTFFFCVWHQKTINSNNFNHFSLEEREINKKINYILERLTSYDDD